MTRRRSWVFVATLALLAVRPGSAPGQSCGTTITKSITLRADLGPCSGVALTVGASNITLNLNGFSIIGAADGTGAVGVQVGNNPNVTIKGPGTITGFDRGVQSGASSSGAKVIHVHFVANPSIALLLGGTGSLIQNNTFSANACIAIKIDSATSAQVVGNAITGSNAPVVGDTCNDQQSPTGGGGRNFHYCQRNDHKAEFRQQQHERDLCGQLLSSHNDHR